MTRTEASDRAMQIPGDPAAVRAFAQRLSALAGDLDHAAGALAAIESGQWVGPAGNAFRSVLDDQPAKFRNGASAFGSTRRACLAFADTLESAQQVARQAADREAQAQEISRNWAVRRESYSALKARASTGDPVAGQQLAAAAEPPCSDPGYPIRAEADAALVRARADVRAAAAHAAAVLDDAERLAPNRPGILHRVAHWSSEFVLGFGEAVGGMAKFVWTYSTVRLLVDPEGWSTDVKALATGLKYGLEHPVDFGKVMLDWETWQESPGRALGRLGPDVILALATAGSGTAATGASRAATGLQKARQVAKAVTVPEAADLAAAAEQLDESRKLHEQLRAPMPTGAVQRN